MNETKQGSGGEDATTEKITGARTLLFPSGAGRITVYGGPRMPEPFQAMFHGRRPNVEVTNRIVSLDYQRFPFGWLSFALRRTSSELWLSDEAPWLIETRRGFADLEADLRGLRLEGFEVRGGVHRARLELPNPQGTIGVRIRGGANRLEIARPVGVEFRIRIRRGVSRLSVDDQRFGAVGGQLDWHTPGYADAADRYDIEISGGASRLTLGTR